MKTKITTITIIALILAAFFIGRASVKPTHKVIYTKGKGIPPTNYILYAPPYFMNFAIKKNMDMQEQMYQDVKAWLTSGMKKKDFVKSKQYDINKFDYWYRKYKAESQSKELGESNNFKEVNLFPIEEAKVRKVLEIESPGGIKITVFE